MQNPLLTTEELPNFELISSKDFEPAIDALIAFHLQLVKEVTSIKEPTWNSTSQRLNESSQKINFVWNIISHLNAVENVEDIRKAYEVVLTKITNFSTDLGQNKDLFEITKKLHNGSEFHSYAIGQRTSIEHEIRGFKLAGVDLPNDKKAEFKKINEEISELENKFEKNLIDSTQSWSYHVSEDQKELLKTLPEHTIAIAHDKAKKSKKTGWVLTLDIPCYIAVMSYAEDKKLREELYKAYLTRASELAEDTKFDNKPLIDKMLDLKFRKAKLLGYENYAEYSLVPKMAKTTSEVMSFLENLVKRSKSQAEKELSELQKFATAHDKIEKLEPWDVTYYSTLYQKINYKFSEEDLRPYFPESKVFSGMFKLAERIFGIKIEEIKNFSKWHDTVRLFQVKDAQGNLRGKFYSDLYNREYKRSGAWMADLRSRMSYADGEIQYPIAFLEGNFTPASSTKPALLSHDEVNTLFHEFGHTLHHILTQVNYPDVAGTNVAYDYVELPSQFMENWCWEWDVLQDISGHYETGDKLPKAEFDKLITVKNFQSAMQMVRQIEFSLFDFRIHTKAGKDKDLSVQEILNDVRANVSVIKPTSYNRFQNSFSHIFAGGYSAGYYSYKWAAVLSSDAFAKFEEDGKFNPETGKLFLETVLEQGGAREAMDIFVDFRGRKPEIDALLRHSGIA
jgi:oligopeptidase A